MHFYLFCHGSDMCSASPEGDLRQNGSTGRIDQQGGAGRSGPFFLGWQSTLCRAQGVGNAGLPRRSEDGYGWVRESTEEYRGWHMVYCASCAIEFPVHLAVREPKICPYPSVSVRVLVRITLLPACALRKALCQPARPYYSRIRAERSLPGGIMGRTWSSYPVRISSR